MPSNVRTTRSISWGLAAFSIAIEPGFDDRGAPVLGCRDCRQPAAPPAGVASSALLLMRCCACGQLRLMCSGPPTLRGCPPRSPWLHAALLRLIDGMLGVLRDGRGCETPRAAIGSPAARQEVTRDRARRPIVARPVEAGRRHVEPCGGLCSVETRLDERVLARRKSHRRDRAPRVLGRGASRSPITSYFSVGTVWQLVRRVTATGCSRARQRKLHPVRAVLRARAGAHAAESHARLTPGGRPGRGGAAPASRAALGRSRRVWNAPARQSGLQDPLSRPCCYCAVAHALESHRHTGSRRRQDDPKNDRRGRLLLFRRWRTASSSRRSSAPARSSRRFLDEEHVAKLHVGGQYKEDGVGPATAAARAVYTPDDPDASTGVLERDTGVPWHYLGYASSFGDRTWRRALERASQIACRHT